MRYLVGIVLLFISSCSYFADTQNFDAFYPYELIIESDKSEYTVNENILLTASVIPDEPDVIHVYEDRTKSFRLSLRAMSDGDIDFSDNDFYGLLRKSTSEDRIDVIEISPSNPYRLTIDGRILQNDKDSIVFDFDEFGTFVKPYNGEFLIWGYWLPINHDPVDSLEDFTKSVSISVEYPK
ncbi:hypothetical protein [Myxosarcina sp. GI1]|uniref:hypothetical protein n=1 Tax=Myxosarcina sp. GI1 TaxID=1541065 RepID=UPI00055CEA9E|nr:hypothetical protein [Myxosarcina sp. GI1]